MKLLAGLLADLNAVKEEGETLLDRTMVIYGSNLGNANTHVTTNLPVIFAGGGFRHGRHLAFECEGNYPLPNLFASMLECLGLEVDRFAASTRTMGGLEPVSAARAAGGNRALRFRRAPRAAPDEGASLLNSLLSAPKCWT
jgi:hypothetical protein